MIIDKREYLEHTKVFEKKIKQELKDGIEYLKSIITDNLEYHNIYTCILDKDNKDLDGFLFPILSKKDDRVYINKDYFELKEIENKEFIGKIYTDEEICRFKYVFEKCNEYDDIIQELYNSFLLSKYTWLNIDRRYIDRMYKIKILEYIDMYIDFVDYKIDYCLDNDFYFNKDVFWNIEKSQLIYRKNLTRLDEISYCYEFDNDDNISILFILNVDKLEDILYTKNKIMLYSKYSNLYIFDVFKIHKFNEFLLDDFSKNLKDYVKLTTLEDIKKYVEKNSNIKVKKVFYSNENINNIDIEDYKPLILKLKIKYIYIEIEKQKIYFDIVYITNVLRLLLPHYDIRVYEV